MCHPLDDHLVFLGDYIDRGPDSAGVLRRILSLSHTHHVTTIKGNHEQMMLDARDGPGTINFPTGSENGGDATLCGSYAETRGVLRDVPPDHWHFLKYDLADHLETETHIFVHANAYPDQPMSEQPDYMLRWRAAATTSCNTSRAR